MVNVTQECHMGFWWKIYNLPNQNVTLYGPLRSFRYFEEISSWLYIEILSHINRTLLSKAERFIESAKQDFVRKNSNICPSSVCVHVRRGDKAIKSSYEKHSYRLPSVEDILNAMNYLESKHQHVVFIVASDTKEWCKQHLQKPNVYVSNLTTFNEDFVLMSSCDAMIMTVGTFGWWAAWLSSQRGGTSMYYNHPFVAGSRKDKAFNRKNCFPSDWIPYNSSTVIVKSKW